MVRDGYYYGLVLLGAAALVGWLTSPVWAIVPVLLAAFFLWFFRDPHRLIPTDPGAVVSPADGKVTDVSEFKQGSERFKRISIFLGDGHTIIFKQIAGLLARRIVFTKKIGDQVERGERVGLIKFGSRTDVLLAPNAELAVKVGDRVKGGSSIIGFLNTKAELAGVAAGRKQTQKS